MNPWLETRRDNTEPKCATCGWWQGGGNSAGGCGCHGIKTLDLSVCTQWRDRELVQDVLPPEKPE